MPRSTRRHAQTTTAAAARAVSVKKDSLSEKNDPDVAPLQDWMSHSDLDFHHFDETTAAHIRSSLLGWYRQHRRRLPWRGDPPPYDGSTAGINQVSNGSSSSSNNSSNSKKKSKTQSNKITNFFQPTTAKKTTQATDAPDTIPSSASSSSALLLQEKAPPVSAYGVWVSEIMLQQTRVEAVIPYWIRWMNRFPTVQALADATEEDVNAHWAGLGFYRRARLLHQGAQLVVRDYQGNLPRTVDELLSIMGIGPYTASAIASIAFDTCVPVVDGNVCRVLSRLTGIANHIKAPALKDKYGWELAAQIVQAGDGTSAGEVNQALMELGATYCAPSGTGIDPRDPLKDYYLSTKLGNAYYSMRRQGKTLPMPTDSCNCPVCDSMGIQAVLKLLEERVQRDISEEDARKIGHAVFPLDPPKSKRREEDLAVAVLSNVHNDEIWWLLVRRPAKGLLAGQWEFPAVCVERRQEGQTKPPTPGIAKRRDALTNHLETIVGEQSWRSTMPTRSVIGTAPLEHIFSHVRHIMFLEAASMGVELPVLAWTTDDGREVRWMRESDMDQVGITSGVKKILKAVKTHRLPVGKQTSGTTKKRKR